VNATTTVKLKDGTEVLIRPMTSADLERSLAFFRALPEEDRACLRRDVTKLEVVQDRMREMEDGSVKRLVGLVGDEIVADGALELAHYGWERHVSELRLIVARPYQHKGLGVLMARALYEVADTAGIEQIVVRMMASQTAARSIFRKLGFRDEAVLDDYLKDCQGRKQDLLLMRCKLEDLWQQYEEYIHQLDGRGFEMD